MKTALMLFALYEGRPLVTAEEVCRDFFAPMTLPVFLRKIGNGEIPLPLVRLDQSQKGPRMIHVTDLASYFDAQAEAARKEARKLAS